jgi:vacuolar-type H+-ATPase subunit H
MPALPQRAPYPIFGEEHNDDVDYDDDSPGEDNGTPLENPAASSENGNPATVVQTSDESNGNTREKEEPDPRLAMGVVDNNIATRNAVLTQAIVLDMAANKQIKLRTSILDNTQQQTGLEDIYNYEELDGYTSPGGSIRMDKSLATVLFIAVAAETPNKLILKARQEAYELVTQQAKDLLEKQRKSYEDQCAKMNQEHQNCMERMKRENDKMLEEATKVRQEYAQAFLLQEAPSIRKIEESQAHIYYEN